MGLIVWVGTAWTWAEDFQSLPLNQTPPGWQVVYTYNATHAGVVRDTCFFYLYPGKPGNPPGNQLLCMDHRHGNPTIDSSVVEVVTPAIPLPQNSTQLALSFDWTVQAGTLSTYVRTYTAGNWSSWSLVDVQADQGHTYGDTVYTHGSTSQTLSLPGASDSVQLRFRYFHDPAVMYTRWVGATVDNVTLTDSTPCCHLTVENFLVDSSYVDSAGNLWIHALMQLCFLGACGFAADTFELAWVVNGDTVAQDTLVFSSGNCMLYDVWLLAGYGANVIELYDNDCCTQPHVWNVTGVQEGTANEPHRYRLLLLRRSDLKFPALYGAAWLVLPDGRRMQLRSEDQARRVLRRLPPGRYEIRAQSGDRWILVLLP